MRKGNYGIFSDVSYTNFTFRPITKKQRLKKETLDDLSGSIINSVGE